jgi:prolyl oligopeptidase
VVQIIQICKLKYSVYLLTSLIFLASCSKTSDESIFLDLMSSEWERGIDENPLYASSMGKLDKNDEWPVYTLEQIKISHAHEKNVLFTLNALNTNKFSSENLLNIKLFKEQYKKSLELHEFKSFLVPFSHRGGIQLQHESAETLPLRTANHFNDWITRLSNLDKYIDGHIQIAREGIQSNIMPPRILMERVLDQIEKQAFIAPLESPFYKAFVEMPSSIPDELQAEIRNKALEVIENTVIPSYLNFYNFFKNEYLPQCRETIGISQIPNGDKYYEALARQFTTTSLNPNEIHEIGLSEVSRIKGEMEKIIKNVKWEGTFREFLEYLRTDSQFYFDNPDDLLTEYLATAKRIDPELVNLFNYLPSMPYGIRPIPMESAPDTTTAYYQRPAADGSRAGYYYVNLYRPEVRPKYEIEVLTVHEAMPGHHLQISINMELDLPNFRKYGGITAFVEGWGLYSEALGYDLGLYKDPYSQFGQLTYEMWRAIRLVVDTGMHYKNWSREDSINYFLENSAKSRQDIINEVDRYINWPGQALAYKIGQMKILELRNKSEQVLGDKFDIKEFHNEILKRGALPLSTLELFINEWLATKI